MSETPAPRDQEITTAAELYAMTPEERHQHFVASEIRDLDALPAHFRSQVDGMVQEVLAGDREQEHRQAS